MERAGEDGSSPMDTEGEAVGVHSIGAPASAEVDAELRASVADALRGADQPVGVHLLGVGTSDVEQLGGVTIAEALRELDIPAGSDGGLGGDGAWYTTLWCCQMVPDRLSDGAR